jgi:general secretion pathway protein H
MVRKVEPVQQAMSPAGADDSRAAEQGFTLLEVVCVLAILAMIWALIPPTLSRGTSRAKLESYAVAAAALLKADRNAALRRFSPVATEIDAKSRLMRSGATGRVVRIPDDVEVDTLLAAVCNRAAVGSSIRFFPSGMSCGGVIALSRLDYGYEIRVNWLTGGVEIVALKLT